MGQVELTDADGDVQQNSQSERDLKDDLGECPDELQVSVGRPLDPRHRSTHRQVQQSDDKSNTACDEEEVEGVAACQFIGPWR
jgi:hypothetical protein